MGMRITTNMMMNTYRFNLMNSTNTLSDARDKVLTQRKFNSYSEDPTTATHAWRIRRAFAKNESYKTNNSDTVARFNIAWSTLGSIKTELYDGNALPAAVRGNTASTAAGRQPLGEVLDSTAESVIQAINGAKYGDHYIFSGDNGLNVPFTWDKDADGNDVLLYRGVNVNAEKVPMPAGKRPSWAPQSAGDYSLPQGVIPTAPGNPPEENEQGWIDYYNSDWAKLEALAHEKVNVDLGMGLEEDPTCRVLNGSSIVDGTAFDMSLPGIAMLGYGVDEKGLPYNGAMVMKALGEIYSRCDPDTGDYASEEDEENAQILFGRISEATDYLSNAYSQVDTSQSFLKANAVRLENQGDYLQEEILNLEQIDMADAITSFSWDYYCYSSALKIGTQLLSESLIDYMR